MNYIRYISRFFLPQILRIAASLGHWSGVLWFSSFCASSASSTLADLAAVPDIFCNNWSCSHQCRREISNIFYELWFDFSDQLLLLGVLSFMKFDMQLRSAMVRIVQTYCIYNTICRSRSVQRAHRFTKQIFGHCIFTVSMDTVRNDCSAEFVFCFRLYDLLLLLNIDSIRYRYEADENKQQ